jgi:hypothetical protein
MEAIAGETNIDPSNIAIASNAEAPVTGALPIQCPAYESNFICILSRAKNQVRTRSSEVRGVCCCMVSRRYLFAATGGLAVAAPHNRFHLVANASCSVCYWRAFGRASTKTVAIASPYAS